MQAGVPVRQVAAGAMAGHRSVGFLTGGHDDEGGSVVPEGIVVAGLHEEQQESSFIHYGILPCKLGKGYRRLSHK